MAARTPRVSVIIATNRDSPFLAAAVASVREQSFPGWELIIVDNGVPDAAGLDATVGPVAAARVVRVPPPVTVSFARNVGVAHARGEFVVFLDDDDVWHRDRLLVQVEALAASPAAPASYCGGWHMDSTGRTFPPSWPAAAGSASDMLAGRSRMPHICGAMMIRHTSFSAVGGFSSELSMMEDFELAIRLLVLGDFVCVPAELVGYRRHGNNATSTGLANMRERRAAIEGILSRHEWAARSRGDDHLAGLLRSHRRMERARAAREAARAALWSARRRQVRDAVQEASWGLRHDAASFTRAVAGRMTGG